LVCAPFGPASLGLARKTGLPGGLGLAYSANCKLQTFGTSRELKRCSYGKRLDALNFLGLGKVLLRQADFWSRLSVEFIFIVEFCPSA